MNVVIMMGRLTAEPDVRQTQSGTLVANYRIAVDRRFKKDGEPNADFFNCSVWEKGAEFAEKWLHKGTKIIITGELQNTSYTNRDGQEVRENKIIVRNQEFAESKASAENVQPEAASEDFLKIDETLDAELPFN